MSKIERMITAHLLSNQAVKTDERMKNVFMIFFLNILWIILFTYFLNWLATGGEIIFVPSEDLRDSFKLVPIWFPPLKWDIFFACIMAPLWEELAFRYAPYKIAQNLDARLGNSNGELLLPVIVISTLIFGWGHGEGPISILIQGIGGLGMTYVYLKNKNSYWSGVALHCLWNSMCVFIEQITR